MKNLKVNKKLLSLLLAGTILLSTGNFVVEAKAQSNNNTKESIELAENNKFKYLLESIRDDYYPETAGCSIMSNIYAAKLLDVIKEHNYKEEDLLRISKTLKCDDIILFNQKLNDIYNSAKNIDIELVKDNGYIPKYSWDDINIEESFINILEGVNGDKELYTKYSTNFRDDDSMNSKVLNVVSAYNKVELITTDGNWSLVRNNNGYGYMANSCVNELAKKYVEVDIGDQKVYMYNNGELIVSSSTVTGKNSTPTRMGYFSIKSKSYDTYLRGPGYKSHVYYWMPFDGGIGLHDALWRDDFGDAIYKNSGSHGCVNLPLDTAKTIYNNSEVGTKVLVHK